MPATLGIALLLLGARCRGLHLHVLPASDCPENRQCRDAPAPMNLSVFDRAPRDVWQTYKGPQDSLPANAASAQKRWRPWRWRLGRRALNVRYESDADARAFMRDNFDNVTFNVYQSMPKGVMKADMWRVAKIYKEGGLYADIDVIPRLHPNKWLRWKQMRCSMLIGLENDVHISNWAFAATPGHPALKSVLDLIVERSRGGVDTSMPSFVHYYTGPGAFTSGIWNFVRGAEQTTACRAHGSFAGGRGVIKMLASDICLMPSDAWRGGLLENLFGSIYWGKAGYTSWTLTNLERRSRRDCEVPKDVPCTCFAPSGS